MQCPHCAHPDSFAMALALLFNATVAKPAEGSSNRYEEAKKPALKQKYVSSI